MPLPKPVKAERSPKPLKRGGQEGKRTSKHRKKRVSLSKRADDAAREACHARGVCEAAGWRETGCGGPLQWAHIMDRSYRRNNLRWRMDNCLLLCRDHHFRWTKKNHVEWRMFLYDRIGMAKALELEREADQGEKGDPARALVILAAFKAEGYPEVLK